LSFISGETKRKEKGHHDSYTIYTISLNRDLKIQQKEVACGKAMKKAFTRCYRKMTIAVVNIASIAWPEA
jgi:hypothetical protein